MSCHRARAPPPPPPHAPGESNRVYKMPIPYWALKLIARTSRDPLATRAPAERDLVNARPRLSNASYQFKSICRAATRQRSRSWARVRREPSLPPRISRSQRSGRSGRRLRRPWPAGGPGSQACTRSSLHAIFARTTPAAAQKGRAAGQQWAYDEQSEGPGAHFEQAATGRLVRRHQVEHQVECCLHSQR
jgi:hypothetical protein